MGAISPVSVRCGDWNVCVSWLPIAHGRLLIRRRYKSFPAYDARLRYLNAAATAVASFVSPPNRRVLRDDASVLNYVSKHPTRWPKMMRLKHKWTCTCFNDYFSGSDRALRCVCVCVCVCVRTIIIFERNDRWSMLCSCSKNDTAFCLPWLLYTSTDFNNFGK